MSQLRKSSSAASQLIINRVKHGQIYCRNQSEASSIAHNASPILALLMKLAVPPVDDVRFARSRI
jgi:hypothetical protein